MLFRVFKDQSRVESQIILRSGFPARSIRPFAAVFLSNSVVAGPREWPAPL